MTRTREQKQRSQELLEKKRADNRRFDADKKKKESERYWRAYDCRPKLPAWVTQRLKALPPELIKALTKKGLDL